MNGHKVTYTLTATVLAVMLTALGHAAFAATDQPAPGPTQSAAIRAFAATALEKTGQAREAIHKNDLARAGQVLSEVQPLLDLALAYRPTAEIKALLHYVQMQMRLEDNKQTLPELLPLYTALNSMPPFPAQKEASVRLDEAKLALETPDRAKAQEALDAMDKLLVIDNIDLPLHAAGEDLDKARQSLQKDRKAPDPDLLFSLEKNLMLLLKSGHE
jgi:hypothetical protein